MADADSSLTPEKKLLKLIEDPPGGAQGEAGGPRGKRGFDWRGWVSPQALQGRLAAAQERWKQVAKRRGDELDLRKITQVVKISVIVFAVYAVGALAFEVNATGREYQSFLTIPQKEMAEMLASETRLFDKKLFEEIEKRNVFIPVAKRVEDDKKRTDGGVSMKLVELTQNLKLVGISVNPVDSARTFCMVEDLKKNVTTFLKVGDTIMGMKVAEIQPDVVVLTYRGEEIELR